MKILKYGVLGIVALLVGFIVFSIFLPDHYEIKKSYPIPCPNVEVYSRVASFKDWSTWNAWGRFTDSSITRRIPGNERGKNAVMILESSVWGTATIKVTEDIPLRYLKHEYIFNNGERILFSTMKFSESNGQTTVDWTLDWKVRKDPLEKFWTWLGKSKVEAKMDWSISGIKRDCYDVKH